MGETIPLDTATDIIEAAEQKADEIGVPSVITIANSEGNLIAQHRMDGAWLASVNLSQRWPSYCGERDLSALNVAWYSMN